MNLLQQIVDSRKPSSLNDLPAYSIRRITKALNLLIKRHSPSKVYLTGSYVTGHYCDRDCPPEIEEYRKTLGKTSISDVDFIIEPHNLNIKDSEYHIVRTGSPHKILIYDFIS